MLPTTIQNIPRFSTPFLYSLGHHPNNCGSLISSSSQPHLSPRSEDYSQMPTTCMIIQRPF